MDRNQAIGFMLIALLLIAYFQFFPATTQEEPTAQEQPAAQVESTTPEAVIAEEEIVPDSLMDAADRQKYGVFAAGARGAKETFTLENEELEVVLSSEGGKIESVRLKEFSTSEGEPLFLLTPKSSKISKQVISNGRIVD